MSDAAVFSVAVPNAARRFLKTAEGLAADALREEVARMRWLAKHGIVVPMVLHIDDGNDRYAVLTQALPGTPADASPLPAAELIKSLAGAMTALHALPAADCPFDETIAIRMARAQAAIAAGAVDVDMFEPRNQGITPGSLVARLEGQKPQEDIVVIHGDATLANLIVDDDGNVGFVDCGTAGRGDRYTDIAVLTGDIRDHYGDDAVAQFVEAYGLPLDIAKIEFFSDLYEFY